MFLLSDSYIFEVHVYFIIVYLLLFCCRISIYLGKGGRVNGTGFQSKAIILPSAFVVISAFRNLRFNKRVHVVYSSRNLNWMFVVPIKKYLLDNENDIPFWLMLGFIFLTNNWWAFCLKPSTWEEMLYNWSCIWLGGQKLMKSYVTWPQTCCYLILVYAEENMWRKMEQTSNYKLIGFYYD